MIVPAKSVVGVRTLPVSESVVDLKERQGPIQPGDQGDGILERDHAYQTKEVDGIFRIAMKSSR